MSGGHPYLWNGTAWVPVDPATSVSGSGVLADTDSSTVTTLTVSPTSGHPGTTITLTATVKAGATNVTAGSVTFERQAPGYSWATISTDSASPWSATNDLGTTLGTWRFRAKYSGSGSYAASTSAEKTVSNTATATPKVWSGYATASRSYDEDGTLRYDYSDSRCYHGEYSSTNGNQRSALWFSVPSEIKGSNVTAVKIRLTRIGGLGDSSVTICCSTHNDATVRSNWNDIVGRAPYDTDTFTGDPWSSADNTTTYTLSSAIHAEFEQGAKGLTIGPSNVSGANYCAFRGVAGVSSSIKPYITIEYTV